MALLKLVDYITEELDKKNYSIGVFIDLSKAFDITDHNLLLKKLSCYGIREIALSRFISYLQNRTQHVSINGAGSNRLMIKC